LDIGEVIQLSTILSTRQTPLSADSTTLFCFDCLFVLGFNVFLTLFQSYCEGTCMRQVRWLIHWNAPIAGT